MKCPTCGTDVAANSAEALAIQLDKAVSGDAFHRTVGSTFSTSVGEVTIIAVSAPQFESQGDTQDAFVIFACKGFLFRKDGYCDSYGAASWHGPLRPVRVAEKVVKIWEDVA